jgi:beta-lactamase superfamily II metal-dependent hydrolase
VCAAWHGGRQSSGNTNNVSYVLRLTNRGVSIILGGDAEQMVWDSIVERYGADLSCDILKASQHGRDSGYHQEAMSLMRPTLTIVSVGKKPETDASNKYLQYSKYIRSTRWYGTMTLTIGDDRRIDFTPEYQR